MEVGEKEVYIGGSGWDGLGENHQGQCQAGAQLTPREGHEHQAGEFTAVENCGGPSGVFNLECDLTKSEP